MSFKSSASSPIHACLGILLALSSGCVLSGNGSRVSVARTPANSEAPANNPPVRVVASLAGTHVPAPEPLRSMSVPPNTTSTPETAPVRHVSPEEAAFSEAVGLHASGRYREAGEAALSLAAAHKGSAWEGRAVFLAARAFAAGGDPAAAATLFGNAREKYPILADYAIYLAANEYAKSGRHEDASALYGQLVSDYSGSVLASGSALDAAREYIELQRYQDVADRIRGFLKTKRSSNQTADANYLLMKAYAGLGKYDDALAQYGMLWREYPGYSATVKAERLAAELAEAGHPAPEPTLEDRLRRADRLYARGSQRSAAGAYTEVLQGLEQKSALRGEALLRLGRSYYDLRENDNAVAAFKEVIEGGYDAQAPDAYYWLSKTHLRGDESALAGTVTSCAARFPGDPRTADCLYLLGVTAQSDGDFGLSKEVLTQILTGFPKTDRRDEVLWWLGLADYRLGDYPGSEATFLQLAAEYPGSTLAPQAIYWQAKTIGMQGRTDEASAMFASLASTYGYSFYGLLASDGGRVDGGDDGQPSLQSAMSYYSPDMGSMPGYGPFARASELGLQGMKEEAVRELRAAEDGYSHSMDGLRLLSGAYLALGQYQRLLELAGGLYSDSVNVGRGTVPGYALEMLYPLAYPDIVLKQAEAFGIDPALVYAVIREESRFNPEAVSPAGAIGLMQLMPGTARAVCAKMNIGFGSTEQLKDEEFNVPLGTCYLASLVERHGGRLAHALAEYNAGPGPLKRWVDKDPAATDEEFIEGITYYETRSYVKRVLRNYMMYRRLYGEKTPQR
ncbi:MAG: transglycosylase SLT domain-containing protein [Nitrospirae bacterium]|nr:transglycosylase SLT domain-containing protein [Nitrospirota bacterium]